VAQPVIIEPEVELTIDPEFWRRVDPTNSISFQEYVNVNSELATSRTVDDESIVNNIIMQQQDETESDEEEIISPTSLQVIPSRRQAEEYIAGLRLYLQSQPTDTTSILSRLVDIQLEVDELKEVSLIQPTISSFFRTA
jgi:hypothetical protein